MAQSRRSKPAPVTKAAIAALESLQRAGVTHVAKPRRRCQPASGSSHTTALGSGLCGVTGAAQARPK